MIKLILREDDTGEEFTTEVDTEDEISSYSITSDFENEEIVICAFESNVELMRLDENATTEEINDSMSDYYTFIILRTKEDIEEYENS